MRKPPRPAVALGDLHRMQFAVDVLAPEIEELAQLGEIRGDVEFLPDESLQRLGLVGQVVDNLAPWSAGICVWIGLIASRSMIVSLRAAHQA